MPGQGLETFEGEVFDLAHLGQRRFDIAEVGLLEGVSEGPGGGDTATAEAGFDEAGGALLGFDEVDEGEVVFERVRPGGIDEEAEEEARGEGQRGGVAPMAGEGGEGGGKGAEEEGEDGEEVAFEDSAAGYGNGQQMDQASGGQRSPEWAETKRPPAPDKHGGAEKVGIFEQEVAGATQGGKGEAERVQGVEEVVLGIGGVAEEAAGGEVDISPPICQKEGGQTGEEGGKKGAAVTPSEEGETRGHGPGGFLTGHGGEGGGEGEGVAVRHEAEEHEGGEGGGGQVKLGHHALGEDQGMEHEQARGGEGGCAPGAAQQFDSEQKAGGEEEDA